VAYLLKARTVESVEQPLPANGSEATTDKHATVGNAVLFLVRAEGLKGNSWAIELVLYGSL
jgi:hypothetical protein